MMVPPLVGWKEAFWPQVHGLSARYRTLSYDLRERGALGAGVTWLEHLSDLDCVARELAPDPFILLGHSLGGTLALQYAATFPHRVRALILSSTFARVRFPASLWWSRFTVQGATLAINRWLPEAWALRAARVLAQREQWVYDRHCDEMLLGLVRAAVRATRVRVAASRIGLARSFDARPWLGRVRCRALVMVGGAESRFFRLSAEELARGIPGAELSVIPEANHLAPLSRSSLYNRIVAEWLEGLARPVP